jgi:hypothetical protein
MNKIMIATIATLVTTAAFAVPVPATPERPAELNTVQPSIPPVGCTDAKTTNKFINDNKFILLYRSQRVPGTMVETWINGKNEALTVSFKKTTNGDKDTISDVCIVDFSRNVMFNGESVDMLHKAIEKANPSI